MGNHGFSIEGCGFHFQHPAAVKIRKDLDALEIFFNERFGRVPGLWIENKGMSLAIHYRNTPYALVKSLERELVMAVSHKLNHRKLKFQHGKKIQQETLSRN